MYASLFGIFWLLLAVVWVFLLLKSYHNDFVGESKGKVVRLKPFK